MHSALALTFGLALAAIGNAQVDLGTAAAFGIVATSAITSTGLTVVNGDIGISPNGLTSITGFPPGISTNPPHGADAVAAQAHADAQTAYNSAQALPFTTSLTGQDLGGLVLGPGVYNFASSAQLTGILTLDGQNNANSVFVFQMGSTITTATAAQVVLINGAKACNVFWQVGSSATLGTSTNFVGNILALASITVNSAVTVNGGLYALTAAVTLIDDTISAQPGCANTHPPTSTSTTVSLTTTPVPTTTTTPVTTMTTTTKPVTTTAGMAPPPFSLFLSPVLIQIQGPTSTVTVTVTKTVTSTLTITSTKYSTIHDTKTITKTDHDTITSTKTTTSTKTAPCTTTRRYVR
ncbi:hypothetical protein MMC30_006793 [Trapelia coarctata]|nr:hypothetical protein [Trapelia coarctata]